MSLTTLPEQRGAVRPSFSGTPGRLRLTAIGAVLAVLVSAVLGAVALKMRSDALGRADSSASHLLLLQGVQTNLVVADADATNAFLKGGLEPQEQRLGYIKAMKAVSNDLVIAAQHSSADAKALGEANAVLNRYSGFVGSARANNRQGFSVGASYLTSANALLSDPDDKDDVSTGHRAIDLIEARVAADTQAVDDAYADAGFARWLLLLAAVVGIGGLLYAQVTLSRQSHRYLNLPIVASTVVLVVTLGGAAVLMAAAQSKANDVRSESLRPALALSASRVAAFTAKSTESLTLIKQGSATPDDIPWNTEYNKALSLVDGDSKTQLEAYKAQHDKINQLDVDGSWRSAVNLATSESDTSANALFLKYDDSTEKALRKAKDDTAKGLSSTGDLLLPVAVLLLLVGLFCAAAAWRGVSFRLNEYR
ncbi:hypothetical protein GCM10022223_36680 [Kineosporia mesophila]|uniref:Chemotaxis methyl-accepting receptor HlyB-like 4HB MCP domain-containing protein n=1 Tax=Kineosporia mesophila TaxID=566012 RepID=A0ABP6ZQC9_9ACTN|nr:hypothetical protein [Kineosporia mesophila]MCD5349905.1 hypothetical protein [Kineosporia mesophila]